MTRSAGFWVTKSLWQNFRAGAGKVAAGTRAGLRRGGGRLGPIAKERVARGGRFRGGGEGGRAAAAEGDVGARRRGLGVVDDDAGRGEEEREVVERRREAARDKRGEEERVRVGRVGTGKGETRRDFPDEGSDGGGETNERDGRSRKQDERERDARGNRSVETNAERF